MTMKCDCEAYKQTYDSLKRKHERLEMVGWFIGLHARGKLTAESAINRIFSVTVACPTGEHEQRYEAVKEIVDKLEKGE